MEKAHHHLKLDTSKENIAAQVTETFEEALAGASSFGIQPGLTVMKRLMAILGDPQNNLPIIHVAGTNGKGSVSAMLESVFHSAGYKTGLYTSPHLIHYGERFQINGKAAEEKKLLPLLAEVRQGAKIVEVELGRGPTEFEILTAIGFLYFQQEQVDVLILEVGLGGRLDATNLVEQPLATVITNVSIDHENFLGNNLDSITLEKAGIIKPGVNLICASDKPEVQILIERKFEEIQKAAKQDVAQIHWIHRTCKWKVLEEELTYQKVQVTTPEQDYENLILPLAGSHQCVNLATAIRTAELLLTNFPQLNPEEIRQGIRQVRWPCRLELVSKDPAIVLDGAHNQAGMQQLAIWLRKHKRSFQRVILVMGMLKDKNRKEAAKEIESLVDQVIITRPPSDRAIQWQAMAKEFSHTKQDKIIILEDNWEALETARKSATKKDLILVTGSLYLVGSLRRNFE